MPQSVGKREVKVGDVLRWSAESDTERYLVVAINPRNPSLAPEDRQPDYLVLSVGGFENYFGYGYHTDDVVRLTHE